ncbi:hypothetical protein FIBSPDRAFT_867249 [Athelia psychrophila]|uniref:DUF6699 domain-containing protein n=1 Tax=Athelia psychrophila TaxID=1759441 RepID=A0A166E8B5_9AGAM|nr:hypothetical protein FIBSPDRAFT_868579 [Fibularhizoctonia sp. CBS 109695]KZP15500.1 hypothetical protein FIBSPDRAFT_867249 [Fibularhizoctonia sp. CBS 109695]
MPGKHVTFAEVNQAYSPPQTPSPSFSVSSLPSSTGPITPPSPFPNAVALPKGAVIPNSLLAFDRGIPQIIFDVSLTTPAVTNTTRPIHLSSAQLADPAVFPPTHTLQIISALPWTLTVTADAQPYVTVLDVLRALYNLLRIPASRAEYNKEPPLSQQAIAKAFHARVERSPATHAEQLGKGLRRVDFLQGRNRFLGLSSTKMGPHVWALNLA